MKPHPMKLHCYCICWWCRNEELLHFSADQDQKDLLLSLLILLNLLIVESFRSEKALKVIMSDYPPDLSPPLHSNCHIHMLPLIFSICGKPKGWKCHPEKQNESHNRGTQVPQSSHAWRKVLEVLLHTAAAAVLLFSMQFCQFTILLWQIFHWNSHLGWLLFH